VVVQIRARVETARREATYALEALTMLARRTPEVPTASLSIYLSIYIYIYYIIF
jgi:hypothetical protein